MSIAFRTGKNSALSEEHVNNFSAITTDIYSRTIRSITIALVPTMIWRRPENLYYVGSTMRSNFNIKGFDQSKVCNRYGRVIMSIVIGQHCLILNYIGGVSSVGPHIFILELNSKRPNLIHIKNDCNFQHKPRLVWRARIANLKQVIQRHWIRMNPCLPPKLIPKVPCKGTLEKHVIHILCIRVAQIENWGQRYSSRHDQ